MKAMAMATTARAITKTTRKVVFSLLSSSSDRLVIVGILVRILGWRVGLVIDKFWGIWNGEKTRLGKYRIANWG